MFAKKIIATSLITLSMIGIANAQSPKKLKEFDAWATYSYQMGGKTVCYALSAPLTSAPSSVNHGDNFFLLSKRAANNGFEPQFMAGYPLKANSKVIVTVDGKNFEMFTKDNSAWLSGPTLETQLVAAMKSGSNMTIKAVSQRGTNTSYSYSLKGVTAALNMAQSCK